MATTPTPLSVTARLDEILHALILLGITAASIFIKNPNTQQHAATIINAVNTTVLPLADELLNPPAAPAAQ